jgi:hypothetical protein
MIEKENKSFPQTERLLLDIVRSLVTTALWKQGSVNIKNREQIADHSDEPE